jgi:hypothetical protein
VPRYLVDIVQALLVLAALFPPVFVRLLRRRRELRVAREAAQVSRNVLPSATEALA